jgi:ABC-type polysaccharide/polyol phosphate transport system ATPase subunit
MQNEIAVKVENLSKIYKLYKSNADRVKEAFNPFRKKYHHDFYALKNLNFEIKSGEVLGIIGKNGSGKSTLLKILSGVLTPSEGGFYVNGKVSSLLELGTGFNPELTGEENVFFAGTIMGYTKEEMKTKLDEVIQFADIGEFIYQPVKTYSSGMFARLAFSVAVSVDPDVLIIDEALSVGDIRFQQKAIRKMKELMDSSKAIVFVSHDVNSIINLCNRVIWLRDGDVYFDGEPDDVVKKYVSYMSYDLETEDFFPSVRLENIEKSLPEKSDNIIFSFDDIRETKDFYMINGWAFLKGFNSDLNNVYIVLKSGVEKFVYNTHTRMRPDVNEKFSDLGLDLSSSGFAALIPKSDFKRDAQFNIGVYVENQQTSVFSIGNDIFKIFLENKAPVKNKTIFDDIDFCDLTVYEAFGEGGAFVEGVAIYSKSPFRKLSSFAGPIEVIFFVKIRVNHDILRPGVGIMLNDEYGNHIFTINNYLYGIELDALKKDDLIVVSYEFLFPNIKNGNYTFTVAVSDGDQHDHIQHHWVHEALIIQVNKQDLKNKIGCYFILDEVKSSVDFLNR